MTRRTIVLILGAALVVACARSAPSASPTPVPGQRSSDPVDGASGSPSTGAPSPGDERTTRVDPRQGGLDVGLGEWAVTLEADHIRPGEVTFVITNHGTMGHGFEIEVANDSSGPGDGGGLKVEGGLLQPGQTDRIAVHLAPGLYKVECLVDGHDDMGMETMLRVSADAPLLRTERTEGGASGSEVSIEGFAFVPARIRVPAGTEVSWTNSDPAEHTVTAADGAFTSDPFGSGATYARTFAGAGTFTYACAIHPEMRGQVTVEAA